MRRLIFIYPVIGLLAALALVMFVYWKMSYRTVRTMLDVSLARMELLMEIAKDAKRQDGRFPGSLQQVPGSKDLLANEPLLEYDYLVLKRKSNGKSVALLIDRYPIQKEYNIVFSDGDSIRIQESEIVSFREKVYQECEIDQGADKDLEK